MLLMSTGPVNQKQSMCMGRYKKIPGFSVEFKPVWKHEQHSRYLCSVDNQWMVIDLFNEILKFISRVQQYNPAA